MIDADAWVELMGVTLAGSGRPDAGLVWSEVDGWSGLPDAKGGNDSIPGSHGSFGRRKLFRESRQITLKGAIYASDNAGLVAIRDGLEAALAEGVGIMKVSTPAAGVWERGVEIDTLDIDDDHGRNSTRFVIDMIAPDPRRYGPAQRVGPAELQSSIGGVRLPQRMPWNFGTATEGSRLTVPNAGAFSMAPVLEVTGGFSQVTIYEIATGRRLRLDWAVSVVDVAVFDCGARRVTVGGADMTRWLRVREWFDIPAGQVGEYRFDVVGRVGDPLLSATFRIGAW